MSEPGDTPEAREREAKRRRRSIAIAVAVAALAILFYLITIVRMGPAVFNRPL